MRVATSAVLVAVVTIMCTPSLANVTESERPQAQERWGQRLSEREDPLEAALNFHRHMERVVERAEAIERARLLAEQNAERQYEVDITSRSTTRPSVPETGNRALGHSMMLERGWDESQWTYLDQLWTRESGWTTTATNPSSGAYGIPQALPGSKMATAGSDWQTNPATQIKWGLNYIAARYGSPEGAWAHSESVGWY